MPRLVPRLAPCAALAAAALAFGTGPGASAAPRGFRLRALSDDTSRASFPMELDLTQTPCVGGAPAILGDDFVPSDVDEIESTPTGGIVAWTTLLSEQGVPGTTRDVVIHREGVKARERLSEGSGDNDQPKVGFDPFGYRVVWRVSSGQRGATTGNIYLRTTTKKDPEAGGEGGEGDETGGGPSEEVGDPVNLTELTGTDTAYDPALCSRTESVDVGSGIRIRERDARIAFVSTGDLDGGRNAAKRPQLFVWRERADEFVQLTRIDEDGFDVNRPSISVSGERIAFECTFDLTPEAVDPADPSRVGNPDGVRQIYLWEERGSRIRQLTWGEADSFAPRISLDGRFVLFHSKADLIPGLNPRAGDATDTEANFEVFAWVDVPSRARALRQLTLTKRGHTVLPRPTRSPRVFVCWSTALSADSGIGEDGAQCGPLPYVVRGPESKATPLLPKVEQGDERQPVGDGLNTLRGAAGENPVAAGPPCCNADATKIELVTNHPSLTPRTDDDLDGDDGEQIAGEETPRDRSDDEFEPDDRKIDTSLLFFHVARAIRR